jgi:predicted membrane-bound mannosyltransferase
MSNRAMIDTAPSQIAAAGSPVGVDRASVNRSPVELEDRPWYEARSGITLTLESLVWIGLLLAATITRFWDLGARTLHHDESIHTYYSWFFATGEIPYRHDPLSHGPFLFHANALIYLLFGGSDATSRFLPALTGVLLVGAPWLLRGRRFLGPWGAIVAGFLLLVSPSFLYYTRYIRHDPYTCLGALMLCIAIFRYLERPQRRWMIAAFISVAFLLTNHEIVFAILLGFVIVLWGALLWGRFRPLVPIHIAAAGALAGVLALRSRFDWAPLPEIPWDNPTEEQQGRFYEQLLANPLVISVLVIGIGFLAACFAVLWVRSRPQTPGQGRLDVLLGSSAEGSLERGVLNAFRDPVGLLSGAIAALFIFFGLFTTLFTNLDGIASSTFATDGTLLYWLGQHDVRRGSQPWFYFITEALQYEWLTVFLGTAGVVVVGWRLARAAQARDGSPRLLFSVLVSFWSLFLFLVLSWAGEKMPWLIMHFTLPAILVAGVIANDVIEGAVAWLRSRDWSRTAARPFHNAGLYLTTSLILLAGGWFFLGSRLTWGVFPFGAGEYGEREITQASLTDWWTLAIPPLIGLALTGAGLLLLGSRTTAYSVLVATLTVMTLYQVHVGFRLAYLEGDIARDTLIYNTTTPDVTQMRTDLADLSLLAFGDDRLTIGYDSCAAWPLTWYFRDMPFANRISESALETPAELPSIVIGVPEEWDTPDCYMPEEIEGYTSFTYVLRWHEPERLIYRQFAIAPELDPEDSAWGMASNPHGLTDVVASVWSSISTVADPAGQQRLFRLLMFRELPAGLNGYEYKLYVRDDLVPHYNDIRYGG